MLIEENLENVTFLLEFPFNDGVVLETYLA